jgi:hypothetical protein
MTVLNRGEPMDVAIRITYNDWPGQPSWNVYATRLKGGTVYTFNAWSPGLALDMCLAGLNLISLPSATPLGDGEENVEH